MKLTKVALITSVSILSLNAHAAPFEECPTQAFLIQSPDAHAIVYGVDLASGDYDTLAPNLGLSKLNGVGFNFHDSYLYGWDYDAGVLSQFDSDYVSNPLNITSGLIGQSFFVGDVSLSENAWYGYRPGQGLYRVDLTDPSAELSLVRVATAEQMGNPVLTDFAFHPSDGYLYAVDNNGFLLRIDVADGHTEVLTEVLNEDSSNFKFTFGAQYFDVEENLYISNNSNGYLYKIDLKEDEPTATFFAYGPESSFNDGARCALAPVEVTVKMDFGDAPESYSTSFGESGPRHLESDLFLGNRLDTEYDATPSSLNNDSHAAQDDDDGVEFVTGLEVGETSLIRVTASEADGKLNAWVDFDESGSFDSDEQIFTDKPLEKGTSTLPFDIPNWANDAQTWARFRVSTVSGIGPTGGVSDGEVEDYPINITQQNVSVTYYPSANDFTSIAYEDLWPVNGDFDMNDLVIHMRIAEYRKDNRIIRVDIDGKIAAIGAGYHNGFALQLPDIAPRQVDDARVEVKINGAVQDHTILESDQTFAVFDIIPDIKQHVTIEEGCKFFRTEDGCNSPQLPTWSISIPFNDGARDSTFPEAPYDPFIYATVGMDHGSRVGNVTGGTPGRQWEVHLKNHAPTDSLHSRLLGRDDDKSNAGLGLFYQNADGLPWALEIPVSWEHPAEKMDIREAYPMFTEFATSEGVRNGNWYTKENSVTELLFKEEQ